MNVGTDACSGCLQWKIYHHFSDNVEVLVSLPKGWDSWAERRIVESRSVAQRVAGRRTAEMIHAGLFEYGAVLTALSGFSLSSIEPTGPVILIAVGIIFLFWLVVFRKETRHRS